MSTLTRLKRRLSTFLAHDKGAVAVIFGVMAIPVVAMAGAALDYSRASNVQAQLQNALDASILFAARDSHLDDPELAQIVRTQIDLMVDGAHGASNLDIDIVAPEDGDMVKIIAEMTIDTTILGIIGVETIDVQADSAITLDFADLEVALVLDNTGSMRSQNRIGSLRRAALDFVRIVTEDAEGDNLRISLVPYTAQVNIGNDPSMHGILDVDGLSLHHGQLLEGQPIAYRDTSACRNREYSRVTDQPLSEERFADAPTVPGFFHQARLERFADVIGELIGVTAAEAAEPFPYSNAVDPSECFLVNPTQISHWALYESSDHWEWKGCVEARPEPFDANDATPDTDDPDTLWVPGFWIDDAGSDSTNDWAGNSGLPHGFRDYRDGPGGRNGARTLSVFKYGDPRNLDIDEIPNNTSGPNKNCADPILPLTDNVALLNDRINDMTYWRGGGTVTAQGVVWGWRTLSPSAPFMEGAPYEEARKVMVVMTDGRNELVDADDDVLGSHYSAYGHRYGGRLPSASVAAARDYIDERTLQACSNAKAAGIIIYTVTFGLDANGREMWDTCATEPAMAYHVTSPSQLIDAFGTIADDVGELRLVD